MLYQALPIFHSSYSSKGQVASPTTTWTARLWGFEMANMEPLEVMARLTCQALRVGHVVMVVVVVSLGVVPCGSPKTVMVKYGFGVWCCWWKKSQKTAFWMYETLAKMGWTTNINWLAEFLPSTVWVICFKLLWIILRTFILMLLWQFESDFRRSQDHHMVIM